MNAEEFPIENTEPVEPFEFSEAYCVEEDCYELATEDDLEGITCEGVPIYEMLCYEHMQERILLTAASS